MPLRGYRPLRGKASNFISNTILRPIKSIDEPVTVHIGAFQAIKPGIAGHGWGQQRDYAAERHSGGSQEFYLSPDSRRHFGLIMGRIDVCNAGMEVSEQSE